MKTKELLEQYYQGLKGNVDWPSLLADDFHFIGGDMTKPEPMVGRDAYVRVLQRLEPLFSKVTVDQQFIEGDRAFVLATYLWTFPKGVEQKGSVAELWSVKDGKLKSLTIFFDTGSFDRLAKG